MPVTTGVKTAQFGVIGLGVMGANLALNVEDHGHAVAVWNLETDWVDRLLQQNPERQLIGAKTLQEFCRSLERPRRILMMITAGDPVDQTLQRLSPFLAPGDIVIDGGNSYFKDTIRREAECPPDHGQLFRYGSLRRRGRCSPRPLADAGRFARRLQPYRSHPPVHRREERFRTLRHATSDRMARATS